MKIKSAADCHKDLQVLELPELEVCVKAVRDTPEAMAKAAAGMTGHPIDYFNAETGY